MTATRAPGPVVRDVVEDRGHRGLRGRLGQAGADDQPLDGTLPDAGTLGLALGAPASTLLVVPELDEIQMTHNPRR